MTSYVFIDTVLQVYESDGNLHIIGGVSNGEVDTKGKDILEKSLHLTMPMQKAMKIIPEIATALPRANEQFKETQSEDQSRENFTTEYEGEGLHFKL